MSADNAGRTWCWSEDAGDVVVEEQPPIAIYTNPAGAVVVRQPAAEHDEDDPIVWFSAEHAHAVAAAILAAAGLDVARCDIAEPAPEPAQDASKPMASTGAERQKRYRQRKKKEPALFDGDESDVTERESVTLRDGSKA